MTEYTCSGSVGTGTTNYGILGLKFSHLTVQSLLSFAVLFFAFSAAEMFLWL